MGRSVSYPSNAIVAFVALEYEDPDDGQFEFDWLVEDFAGEIQRAYPAAYAVDKWLDREDHAVAANGHAYFGVSEYMGLVALWAVARDDSDKPELAEQWLAAIAPGFVKRFGQLRMIGRFSNGEAIFERMVA